MLSKRCFGSHQSLLIDTGRIIVADALRFHEVLNAALIHAWWTGRLPTAHLFTRPLSITRASGGVTRGEDWWTGFRPPIYYSRLLHEQPNESRRTLLPEYHRTGMDEIATACKATADDKLPPKENTC